MFSSIVCFMLKNGCHIWVHLFNAMHGVCETTPTTGTFQAKRKTDGVQKAVVTVALSPHAQLENR